MPYIHKKDREKFSKLRDVASNIDNTVELTYCIFYLLKAYIKKFSLSYKTSCDCMASVENAKLEFYRRHISIYEDQKISINGDVDI